MTIDEKINYLLQRNKMQKQELAQRANMPLSTLSDLLNGKTKKLDIQKAKDICNVLGCTLDYLIDEKISKDNLNEHNQVKVNKDVVRNQNITELNDLTADKEEIFKKIKKMSDSEVRAVLAFVDTLDNINRKSSNHSKK